MAFSITVVSTIKRFRLAFLMTFARFAASIVSASSSSTPASPSRLRQRVRLDRSTGGFVCKYVSPVNTCQYGFSSHCQTTSSSDRSKACCKYSNQTRRARRPAPQRDEARAHRLVQPIPIGRIGQPYQRMLQVICSRSGWRKKSPSGTGVFGSIQTSSEFAGISRQYARPLQIPQHRFSSRALLYKPWRIVQGRLFSYPSIGAGQHLQQVKPCIASPLDPAPKSKERIQPVDTT